MGRACSTNGRQRKMHIGFCWEREEGPLGSCRRIWDDNIKMDIREIGLSDMDLIHLVQDRDQWRAHADMVMNIRIP
jgi:hypothetical protein